MEDFNKSQQDVRKEIVALTQNFADVAEKVSTPVLSVTYNPAAQKLADALNVFDNRRYSQLQLKEIFDRIQRVDLKKHISTLSQDVSDLSKYIAESPHEKKPPKFLDGFLKMLGLD